jgi:hypothetical protein
MKNYKRGFVPLLIILIVVAVAGGGGYVYLQKKSPTNTESPLTTGTPEQKKPIAPDEYFPETIGDYELVVKNTYKVQVTERECRQFGQSQAKEDIRLGIVGEYCVKNIRGEYRQKNTDKVVFVDLQTILSGKDVVEQLFEKTNTAEKLGTHSVYRAEGHEILWKTENTFDIVITQEGRWKKGTESNGALLTYSYKEKATGNNAVSKYFLEKYPPVQVPVSIEKKMVVATTTKNGVINPVKVNTNINATLVKVLSTASVGTTEEGVSVIEPADFSFELSPYIKQLKTKELTINGTKIRIEAINAREDDSNYTKNVCAKDRIRCFKVDDWMTVTINGKSVELAREDIVEVQFENKTSIYISAIDVEDDTTNSGSDIWVKKK